MDRDAIHSLNSSNSPTKGGLERLVVGAAEGLEQGVGEA